MWNSKPCLVPQPQSGWYGSFPLELLFVLDVPDTHQFLWHGMWPRGRMNTLKWSLDDQTIDTKSYIAYTINMVLDFWHIVKCLMILWVDVRSHHADGDDFLISLGRFSSYGAWTPQILHSKTLFLPYDVCDDVPKTLFEHIRAKERGFWVQVFLCMLKPVGLPGLASLLYMVTVDRIRGTDAGVVLRSQIQVLKTLQRQKRRMVLNKS